MNNEEKSETLAGKAKAQFDALKTQEGRDALKDKVKEGAEGAKKLWNATSIAQRVGVLAVAILATMFLTRSCGPSTPTAVAPSNTAKQENKEEPKFEGFVNLAKANDKTDTQKSFVGFTFGTKADDFKDVKEEIEIEDGSIFLGIPSVTNHYYRAKSDLRSKFRLFKSATLKFTQKSKRLYKIIISTTPEDIADYKPTSIMREALYCAALIERKYGSHFNIASTSQLYSKVQDKSKDLGGKKRDSGYLARTLGTAIYAECFCDSVYAIAPEVFYRGFFNNTIEIMVYTDASGDNIGITISAIDHGVIEEDGGHTKVIPLNADADEGNL